MKIKSHQLSREDKIRTLDALYTTAGLLKGREAMKLFLRDLLTESERIMLGRRILIARMLLSEMQYDEIAEELGVGFDTIRRVHRWLLDQVPGYEQAIKEMNVEMERREEKRRMGRLYADMTWRGTIARLKKKYPLHFLLIPWPAEHSPKTSGVRNWQKSSSRSPRRS